MCGVALHPLSVVVAPLEVRVLVGRGASSGYVSHKQGYE